MGSIMRRTVRGTAAGLGALAIITGSAACGSLLGGDDRGEGGDEPTVEEQEPADDGMEEDTEEDTEQDTEGDTSDTDSDDSGAEDDTDAGDEGDGEDSSSGGALSEDDLSAVADRYYEFIKAAVEGDGETGCGLLLNPYTGKPLEGSDLEACAEGFSGAADEEGMDPSMLDVIDPSMIEGVDNGDGTAGVSLLGQDGDVTFIKGDDGQWYIDSEDFL